MTHQLPNGYEAVTVPEGAENFDFCIDPQKDGYILTYCCDEGQSYEYVSIPDRVYTLIGRGDEVIEEQAAKIVGNLAHTWVDSAVESFLALLASLSLNPKTTVIIKKENV